MVHPIRTPRLCIGMKHFVIRKSANILPHPATCRTTARIPAISPASILPYTGSILPIGRGDEVGRSLTRKSGQDSIPLPPTMCLIAAGASAARSGRILPPTGSIPPVRRGDKIGRSFTQRNGHASILSSTGSIPSVWLDDEVDHFFTRKSGHVGIPPRMAMRWTAAGSLTTRTVRSPASTGSILSVLLPVRRKGALRSIPQCARAIRADRQVRG